MVEITQEESVTKTESWDAPTVRDLTEGEEDSEEGTERAHSKRNGGKNDLVKFLKEGIISVSFMERMLSILFLQVQKQFRVTNFFWFFKKSNY